MSKLDSENRSGFLVYRGNLPGSIGICHLRVLQGDNRLLFLASEMTHNPGPSITNAIEHIWEAIQQEFSSQIKWDKSPMLVEHYSDEAVYGDPSGGDRYAEAFITPGRVIWQARTKLEISLLAGVPVEALKIPVATLTLKPDTLEQEAKHAAQKPHLHLV